MEEPPMKVQKVNLPEPEILTEDYIDNNYWRVGPKPDELDVDSLLAELEG